jgi:hypothetical protein
VTFIYLPRDEELNIRPGIEQTCGTQHASDFGVVERVVEGGTSRKWR